jgi:hypothetical protein
MTLAQAGERPIEVAERLLASGSVVTLDGAHDLPIRGSIRRLPALLDEATHCANYGRLEVLGGSTKVSATPAPPPSGVSEFKQRPSGFVETLALVVRGRKVGGAQFARWWIIRPRQ